MNPIVTKRTDIDMYKLSMAQAVFHNYSDAMARYSFTCRSDVNLKPFIDEIYSQIHSLNNIRFDPKEISLMKNKMPFLSDDFLCYLYGSVLNTSCISIKESNKMGGIDITIEGPWLETIWFEIPILAIISEIYVGYQMDENRITKEDAINMAKVNLIKKIWNACNKYELCEFPKFSDFGTRRRASLKIQKELLKFLKDENINCCIGTSNIMLGLEYDMKIIGTMAHEWIMAHSGFTRFDLSQRMALDVWQKEYRDKLGVALSDTYTTDFFLNDFDGLLAKSFSGVRQDSGDPIEIGYKFINHYEKLGIDPTTKQIIFSDGLNFNKIAELYKEFNNKIQVGFGIGTNFTSDIREDIKPLNAVIKMTHIKRGNDIWWPLIKISDSVGKTICQDNKYKDFILNLINNCVKNKKG